ncbi:hypothetical protein [Labrys neptuniae]
MALGFVPSAPTNFLPILKYNPHEGRFLRIDRGERGLVTTDITENFAVVIDMETIEAGWMHFGRNVAPDLRLFPLGQPWPEAPSLQHKRGLRVVMQLSEAHGGDIRELSSTAYQFLIAFDALHDAYLAGRDDNPGKLPVVVLTKIEPGRVPEFTIAGWVKRPEALREAA